MNKKIRYYFWIVEAFLKKHALKLLGVIALIAALVYGIYAYIPYALKPKEDVFYEAVVGKYTLKTLPPQVLEYVSHGLVQIDLQGNPTPDAAESIVSENNGKKFTIKLKNDVKWHDNTTLKSTDLGYNLADVEVTKPDASTIIFNLKDSFAPFPTLLSGPLLKITPDGEVLGIGNYRISEVAYRQTQYISSLTLESDTQKPKKIVVNFYPTEQDAETAFKLGKVYGLRLSPNTQLSQWNNGIVYEKTIPRRFVGIFFQLKDSTVGGKDSSLRKALTAAIPDLPEQKPFTGPLPENSWAELPVEGKRFDLEKAKVSLDKYKQANKGNNTELKVTLTTLPVYKKTAEHVANAWTELGVKTELQIVEKIPEEFQALLTGQELPADPDQYAIWHSTQKGTNITNYNNLRVDKDLEDARKTVDINVRKEKYIDFQKQIREDIPVIYLYQPYHRYILQQRYNTDPIKKLKKFTL
jgi:ABC-type transport system substrate-binding protein